MKINRKIFDKLVREPNEVQEIDGKTVEIFLMTKEEASEYETQGRYSIWSSDGKSFRVLINEDYYNYGAIKDFYKPEVNGKWVEFTTIMSGIQKQFWYMVLLPMVILYIVGAVLSIVVFKQEAQVYVFAGLLIITFIIYLVYSRISRKKINEVNEKIQLDIQEILGVDLYDQIANDQLRFRDDRNKAQNEYLDDEDSSKQETKDSNENLEEIEETKDEVEEIKSEGEDINV